MTRNDRIDALYARRAALLAGSVTPGNAAALGVVLARLRALQEAEAADMRRRFDERHPPGEGARLLDEAAALLGRWRPTHLERATATHRAVAFDAGAVTPCHAAHPWVWLVSALGCDPCASGSARELPEAQAAAEEVLGERGPWRTIAWRRTAGAWTAAVVALDRLEAPEPRAAWSWRVWHAALHDDGWREGGPCGEAPTAAEARACAEAALRAAGGT